MSEKIKTSEEIRVELADKKVAKTYLAEFENGINQKLIDFKGFLSEFNPNYQIKHKYDTEEIKTLNIALNEVYLKLKKDEEKFERKVTYTESTIPFSKDFILENLEGVVKKVDKGDKLPYKCNIVYDYIEEAKRRQIINHIFKVQEMLLKFSNKV